MGDQGEAFFDGLGDEDAVEGIRVVIGKTGQAGSMAILDGEGPEAPRFNLLFQMIRGLEFSE